MADSPELTIKTVLDLSGARQSLSELQQEASLRVGAAGAGSFAAEAAPANSIGGPIATAAGAGTIPPLSVANMPWAMPSGALLTGIASGSYGGGGMGAFAGVSGGAPSYFAGSAGGFSGGLIQSGLITGGPQQAAAQATAGDSAGGGGSSSFLPVGRGLTAMSLIHGLTHNVQTEEQYSQRLREAGGNPVAIANAELRRRTDSDSLFFGVGRLGRAIREADPFHAEATTQDIQSTLSDVSNQDRQIGEQQQAVSFMRTARRQADVATAPVGVQRRMAEINGEREARGDSIRQEFTGRRASEEERYQRAVAGIEHERDVYSEHHTHIPGTGDEMAPYESRLASERANHSANLTAIGAQESQAGSAADAVQRAKISEAANETAATRVGIATQTANYQATASGSRGRDAELQALRRTVGGRNQQAMIRGDDNLDAIIGEGRAEVAAKEEQNRQAEATESIGLQGAAKVSGLQGQGRSLAAAVARIDLQRDVDLSRMSPNDPNRGQVAAKNEAAINAVLQTEARNLYTAGIGDAAATDASNLRASGDVLGANLRSIEGARQTELSRLDPDTAALRTPGINARYDAAAHETRTEAARREIGETGRMYAAETTAGLDAEGRPYAAQAKGIELGAMAEITALRGPGAMEKRRSVLQRAIYQEQALAGNLTYGGNAQEVEAGSLGGDGQGGALMRSRDQWGHDISGGVQEANDAAKALQKQIENPTWAVQSGAGGTDMSQVPAKVVSMEQLMQSLVSFITGG